MLLHTVCFALLALTPPDTIPRAPAVHAPAIPTQITALPDTVPHRQRPRAVAVSYSDAYYTRLRIHRDLSFSIYPLYVTQYFLGQELFNKGSDAPTWVKTGHRVVATTLVGVFGVNTVTGLWNLWDSRADPTHRWLRYTHALTMLASDAAFSYAGSTLATQAQNSLSKRRLHRTITLSAMGLSATSALVMLWANR